MPTIDVRDDAIRENSTVENTKAEIELYLEW